MIITLRGANFSANNIGTLSVWRITKSLKNVTTDNTVTSIDKNAEDKSYTATFTVNSGYTFSSATVTMGGEDITSNLRWNSDKTSAVLMINVVTGNVVISIIATSTSSGGGGESGGEGGGEGESTNVSYSYNAYISDDTGEVLSATESDTRFNQRAVTNTVLVINKGDTITTSGNNVQFIGYAWQNASLGQFLGYMDFDPSTTSNWSTSSYTFGDTAIIGGSSKTVTYPLYVKLVFKPVSGTFTLDDVSSSMTYNVSGYNN